METIIRQTNKYLIKNRKTLSVAESCTGGLFSFLLTSLPGSSKYFKLGAVVYSNQAKHDILGIPLALIKKHGAVSQEVAEAMAHAVRRIAKTDYGIGITGIAGPSGGTKIKPIGTVFIAVTFKNGYICNQYCFKGNRSLIQRQSALAALHLLRRRCS
ncbi:MAG: CinA family protein [Candidatus Omnitrophica bacterium]|jgi:nicotinamide-nucleotide amidase|nr:CinA family protein [Candidatus Omnitrophota bacterium]MDD5078765.1 CinA family protein [Candidatus Omnitrophota bacterium]